jgi:hypothetical protein
VKLLGGLGVLGALMFNSGWVMAVLLVIGIPVALGTVGAEVAPTFFSYVGWALPLLVNGLLAIVAMVVIVGAMWELAEQGAGSALGILGFGAAAILVVSVVFWILFTLTGSAFVGKLDDCPVSHLPRGPEFCTENQYPQPPFFHWNGKGWGNF